MLDQIFAEFVVAVVRCGQERRPAVFGGLVDIGSGSQQEFRRFQIAFASRKNQGRQTTATASDQARNDDVGIIFLRRSSAGGSVSCAALLSGSLRSTALSASTLSTTALTAAALCGLRALLLSGSRSPGSRSSSRRSSCGTALLLLVAVKPAEGIPSGAAHTSHTAVGDVDGKLFFVGLSALCGFLTNLEAASTRAAFTRLAM